MAKENKTRYALLGFLSSQPASGYEIKKKMEQSTNHFWREGDSSIYPILKQLLDEGMVTCALGNKESDKPKKVYAITHDGQLELQEWLKENPVYYPHRNELLLKIFFGWNVKTAISINHIENFRHIVKSVINDYQAKTHNVVENKLTQKQLYQYLTLKAGIIYSEASIRWCDDAIKLLKKRVK